VKHVLTTTACAALLFGSLTACGSSDSKSTLPAYTGGASPSATTSRPATTAPTATATGPVALVPHATYTYGGLKVVLNLPANISAEARSSTMTLSEFFQARGRSTAENKLDPSVAEVASPEVVQYVQRNVVPGSVEAIGSVTYTISKVEMTTSRAAVATGCVDQSKLAQVRKDGSRFADANTIKNHELKMTVDIFRGMTGPKVTRLTFVTGTC